MTTQHISWDELQIEQLDDIPLLIGLQQRLGLDAIIDDVIPRPYQGLSLGQLGDMSLDDMPVCLKVQGVLYLVDAPEIV